MKAFCQSGKIGLVFPRFVVNIIEPLPEAGFEILSIVITLVIASQKGGVGKTTVAINLAYSLARRGWKTLLMDTDPQGSVGLSLSEKARTSRGFYDVLTSGAEVDSLILPTRLPEYRLLPAGGGDLYYEGMGNEGTLFSSSRGRITELFHRIEGGGFDLTIVDTPAGVYGITGELLRFADHVLLPQQVEPLSLRSIPQMLKAVVGMEGARGQKAGASVLLTMLQEDETDSVELAAEIRELLPDQLMCDTRIPRAIDFLKASRVGVPLGLLYKKPTATALVFDQLAAEMENELGLESEEEENEYTRLMD